MILGSKLAKLAATIVEADESIRGKNGEVVIKPKCHPERPYYINNMCRLCYSRRAAIRKIMGSNYDETLYDKLLQDQGGLCKVCKEVPEEYKPLYVDHDHNTMIIRGLICCRCNNLLRAWVTPDRLRMVANYIEAGMIKNCS